MLKNCIECYEIGIYNQYFKAYLCRNCRDTNNNYILITKTNAKKHYLLTNDDLISIKPFNGRTTSSYGEATYFIKNDLINFACNKYNTDENNLENIIKEIITEKNNKKQLKKDELKTKRKNKLLLRINKVGLTFRDDSVLYKKYIDGNKENSLDFIIKRMMQMKYLFEYCHMDECKSEAYEHYCEEVNAGYFPDCSVLQLAESIALKKYSNGKYPNVYPWQ
jgi:hypothetical protein